MAQGFLHDAAEGVVQSEIFGLPATVRRRQGRTAHWRQQLQQRRAGWFGPGHVHPQAILPSSFRSRDLPVIFVIQLWSFSIYHHYRVIDTIQILSFSMNGDSQYSSLSRYLDFPYVVIFQLSSISSYRHYQIIVIFQLVSSYVRMFLQVPDFGSPPTSKF